MGMTAVLLAVSDYSNGVILRVDGGMSLVNPYYLYFCSGIDVVM